MKNEKLESEKPYKQWMLFILKMFLETSCLITNQLLLSSSSPSSLVVVAAVAAVVVVVSLL